MSKLGTEMASIHSSSNYQIRSNRHYDRNMPIICIIKVEYIEICFLDHYL